MKKSSLEVLLGLALVAAWIVVAAQAERSQRVGSSDVAVLENTRVTAAGIGAAVLPGRAAGGSPARPASSPGA